MSSPLIAALLAFASVTMLVWALKHLSTRFAKRYQETFTSSARTNLFDMFLFIEPRQLFVINMLTLLAVPFVVRLFFGSWVLGILVSIVLALLPRFAYQFLHKRRRRKFVHQLPDALNMVASSMQSGANVSNAIEFMAEEMEAPIKQEFQLFLREQRLGVEFNTALDNMFKRIPEEEFQLVTAGMQISREVGGNLAEVLLRLSATLRKKIEMEGKIDALTSQGKMQGIVMTLLPVFIGVVLYHMEPSAMGRIFTEPMGWALIALVIIMLSSGYLSIRKIVAIDV
ncbi:MULTISPECIES: type II secretion system F family protein [Shewanella]|uniref:type II secretion system F family protein n=1 Tax=Shewanella TaxID=22 RepID=UPI00059FC110|nr:MULTISPECIES: type II secretion system F family protein [Shewanella]KIO38124.1 secretion system protein F [Shewanella sp. cp20]MCG9747744.1 type II secretion system F family protein [Shewanella sp. Isolate8]MCL2908944.1 type II secretion system F family protein [Shewanella aquimarina]